MTRTALFSRHQPGGVFTIEEVAEHPGEIFFVHSGTGTDGAGYGNSPDAPLATVDYAIGLCTANKGDVIYVLPGHAETISAAGGVTMDVAGVKVIGLGWGAQRPTFTFSATTSTWAISAASCTVKSIRVTSSVNELVSMFNITAADVTLDAVDYIDPGTGLETIQFVLTTSAADRLTIKNCRHLASTAAASAQLWIALVGVDQPRIVDNTFILVLNDAATSSVINGDASVTNAEFGRNVMHVRGYTSGLVSPVLMHASATGIHYDSRIYCDTTVVTTINTFAGGASFEVYCSNDLDKNGLLDPVVGS